MCFNYLRLDPKCAGAAVVDLQPVALRGYLQNHVHCFCKAIFCYFFRCVGTFLFYRSFRWFFKSFSFLNLCSIRPHQLCDNILCHFILLLYKISGNCDNNLVKLNVAIRLK